MKQHPLISYATTRPYKDIPEMPESAQYDIQRGFWVNNDQPLILTEEYSSGQMTKKCDQETGEDQKGE